MLDIDVENNVLEITRITHETINTVITKFFETSESILRSSLSLIEEDGVL